MSLLSALSVRVIGCNHFHNFLSKKGDLLMPSTGMMFVQIFSPSHLQKLVDQDPSTTTRPQSDGSGDTTFRGEWNTKAGLRFGMFPLS